LFLKCSPEVPTHESESQKEKKQKQTNKKTDKYQKFAYAINAANGILCATL
jgi:hypothetical protein